VSTIDDSIYRLRLYAELMSKRLLVSPLKWICELIFSSFKAERDMQPVRSTSSVLSLSLLLIFFEAIYLVGGSPSQPTSEAEGPGRHGKKRQREEENRSSAGRTTKSEC
jgi:hypothetical protein